jgi:hypothetical protein
MMARIFGLAILAAVSSWAQNPQPPLQDFEQPNAQRTQQEVSNLLQRYPPALREVLALDPSLLANESYLAPYPALVNFLRTHPEVARAPSFYVGEPERPHEDRTGVETARVWENMLTDVMVFAGFSLAFGLIAWLIRTFIDYRRWNRLTNLQTEVHTKLMDRLNTHEDLLAYVQSPAGSRFLESTPITLDAGPRSVAAPLGRILWTVQGGVVLIAAGIGLQVVAGRVSYDASQPLRALGILAMALGFGLVVSAVVSFMISRRLGLIGQSNAPATQG